MSIKKDIVLRVRIAFLLTFLVAGAVIYRIAMVQYVKAINGESLGETLGIQAMNVKATRGNIYADDGSLLATSLPFYQLALDPSISTNGLYKNNIDSLCYFLSRYYKDLSPTQYKRKIDDARKNGSAYLVLNRQEVGYQDKKRMEQWPILREENTKEESSSKR